MFAVPERLTSWSLVSVALQVPLLLASMQITQPQPQSWVVLAFWQAPAVLPSYSMVTLPPRFMASERA